MTSKRTSVSARWMPGLIALIVVALIAGCSPIQVEQDNTPLTDQAEPLADLCQAELEIMATADSVEFVRTPDACFEDLTDWPHEAHYVEIDGLRQAYVDVGPADADETILLLHGQPSWSYLYRKMIPVLADAGHRVIAMDHVGMGRSDKPIDLDYYSYLGHVERLEAFIQELELEQGNLTVFVQDWGSLIGLYVVGTYPDWFDRVVVGNGFLPPVPEGEVIFEYPKDIEASNIVFHKRVSSSPGQQPPIRDEDGNLLIEQYGGAEEGFGAWAAYALYAEDFAPSLIIESATYFDLTDEEQAAYGAPFPSRITMGGPRTFPSLANELGGVTPAAWPGLLQYGNPFLTIWGNNDQGNLGDPQLQQALIDRIPGAEGWDHVRLPEASHFLQDDQGEEIARRINTFIVDSPLANSTSLLNYHNGYWVTEMQVPDKPLKMKIINDMHVDSATNRVTVYAQTQLLGNVFAPPQVGPGECTKTLSGETFCFHPDAVYLNGSGEELMEADGTGAWWIKHSWILDGEGYMNCEARPQAEYNDCFWVEGVLLADGLSMKVGVTEESMKGFYNIRMPLLGEDSIRYQVTRFAPKNADPEAGEIDLTPTEQFVLTWDCVEEASAFDNQARECPKIVQE